MIKMIKKMICGIIGWATTDKGEHDIPSVPRVPRGRPLNMIKQSSRDVDFGEGMYFKVYRANGGTIIQIITPHPVKIDEMRSALYVVTDDQDLGDEIAQIITRESLSR